MKAYMEKKLYRYNIKNLDLNKGIEFLKSQIEELNNLNIDILNKCNKVLENNQKYSNKVEAMLIKEDINKFLNEHKVSVNKLYKLYNKVSKGVIGENKIKDIIYQYDNRLKILQNATLNVEGINIENDFLLIDKSGITTIEVKNIGSAKENLIIDELGRVSRYNKFGSKIDTIDMIEQSNRHQNYLQKYINTIFDYEVPIHSYIVISSDIKIKNKSDFNIVGPNTLINNIFNHASAITKEQSDMVYQYLLQNLKDNITYQYIDYSSCLNNNYNLILRALHDLFHN